MFLLKKAFYSVFKLLLFWVVFFDIQRVFFSLHNWSKFENVTIADWLLSFVYSFRLDLAAAAILSIIPTIFLLAFYFKPSRWSKMCFFGFLFAEVIINALLHSGEINAYAEWNHKLTTRVFTHLKNPDEVFRTADYGMTIWFSVYAIIQSYLGFKWMRWLFQFSDFTHESRWFFRLPIAFFSFVFFSGFFLFLARGGAQQIPINIDSAYYHKEYIANDLSVNSFYFFTKSFLLYNRSEVGVQFPILEEDVARQELTDFFSYPVAHDQKIVTTKRPNIVFILLESWTANAIGSISGQKGATPYFDTLAAQGVLFTQIYATGGTSEIGNSSIFSGYPALPEISISMQPDKHRKIPSFNQDLKKWGYSSHYLFSGDLKYGNIGGYFMDHGFDVVEDENDFPSGLKRGKLNYYDEDLYALLLKKISATKGPFLHCAFTGSTHSPYDYPNRQTPKWHGLESDFMSSMFYADKCLHDFMEKAKKQPWYKNTLFVLVADHGHASPALQNPNLGGYFHVPLLFFGEPIQSIYRGKKITKLGSQADIVRTLLYQMEGDFEQYIWSKDLLNPASPEFALHTINRGYGWITPDGNFSYHMDAKNYPDLTYSNVQLKQEEKRCHSFMSLMYNAYKKL